MKTEDFNLQMELNVLETQLLENNPNLDIADSLSRINSIESNNIILKRRRDMLNHFLKPKELKIGSKVFVKNGGAGSFGASDLVAVVVTEEEAKLDKKNYSGELYEDTAEVYIRDLKTDTYWGLCRGHELVIINI